MKITRLYYFPFDIDPAVPINLERLQSPPNQIDVKRLSGNEQMYIRLYITNNRLCAGKIKLWNLRMLVEFDNGKGVALVDYDGCVRWQGKEYYLRPGTFVRLFQRMENLRPDRL